MFESIHDDRTVQLGTEYDTMYYFFSNSVDYIQGVSNTYIDSDMNRASSLPFIQSSGFEPTIYYVGNYNQYRHLLNYTPDSRWISFLWTPDEVNFENFGLELFGADGRRRYHSSMKPMVIIDYLEIPFGSTNPSELLRKNYGVPIAVHIASMTVWGLRVRIQADANGLLVVSTLRGTNYDSKTMSSSDYPGTTELRYKNSPIKLVVVDASAY